ncbi:hypothetical protein GCM10008024_25330 [Allgaiera indica]|uniref:Disulphide bond corrector protein DsbC n=1 Tax=Allgaiera indica TaxID=765699 RepID=A0AAN5A016_9RHOB|nr:hypothetical protein GCM10008024_25330 [Allgaiera indica]SDX10720.1 Disulphide bond corrector protein DsbC [Allgaiera indica]
MARRKEPSGAAFRRKVIPPRSPLPYPEAVTRFAARSILSPVAAAVVAAAWLCGPGLALAARASGIVDPAQAVSARVLPGWRMADGHRMAALELSLAPGWHTYWRAPGEAGIPPSLDWSASTNLKAVTIHWPVPQVFDIGGVRSIGYVGRVVLPLELTPKTAGAPIALRAGVDLGVCDEICLPVALSVSADLGGPGGKDAAIAQALARRPETAAEAGLTRATCSVEPIADGLRVTARLMLPPLPGREVTVMELPDPTTWVSGAKTTRRGNMLTAVAEVVPVRAPFTLDRKTLTITVLGRGRAVELHGCGAG